MSGAMLANESILSVDEVVLLVTDEEYDELTERGWPPDGGLGGLQCPFEPQLFVRAGDVSDTYLTTIPELVAEAWREDGIPFVSMQQIDAGAVRQFLSQAVEADEVSVLPASAAWTWPRLKDALTRLELPDGQYVVGLAGALLANESLTSSGVIELLVTGRGSLLLQERGWFDDDAHPRLLCPSEDDLVARSDGVGDTYLATVPELVAEAWREDGIPFVSLQQVHPESVRALLAAGSTSE